MLGLTSALSSSSEKEQNYSLTLDGVNDHVDLGDVLDVGTADYSTSVWIKQSVAADSFDYILAKHEDSDNRVDILLNDNNKIQALAKGSANQAYNFTGGTALDALIGTWVNITITVDRDGQAKMYVNGSTSTYGHSGVSCTDTSQNLNNAGNWNIGRKKATANYWGGLVGDIAIWNVALDADAVAAVYNSGTAFNLNVNRGNYDNSSALQGYLRMGSGIFDDKANGVVRDQVNPGYGSNLVSNADFSANGAESLTYLNGGLVFDDWSEQNSSGLRKFELTSDGQGIRCTIETATSQTWHQRIYQDVSDHLDIGSSYEFSVDILVSASCAFRAAVQTSSSSNTQTSFSNTATLSAGVRNVIKDVFTCDNNSSQVVHLFPSTTLSAGEYYEIRNPRLRKINGVAGLVTGATFSSDNPNG